MEANDIFCLLSFTILLYIINIVHHLICQSIKEKALGCQSIYDCAMHDTFLVMRCYSTFICLIYILSRFELIKEIFIQNNTLLTAVCLCYSFGFTCQCINAGCVCIIRILCLAQMSFMDETVGEFMVRLISLAITFTTGFGATLAFFLAGESTSGSLFTILTDQVRPSGVFFYSVNLFAI